MKKSMKPVLQFSILIFLITAAVFAPVLNGEFLNWDDEVLFLDNPYFRGLGADNWQWMCTTFFYGHWQPLSWLSYALDYCVWGMDPHGWHVTNWMLHALNASLVFFLCLTFLKKSAGRDALSAGLFAALFYAIHPLRVEAVAWLATRGYLLGTTFCLLTCLWYVRAVRERRYPLLALLFFTLAVFTKGISMMVPPVLLLIDWFPLKRITSWRRLVACVAEKIPFFLLSFLTGIMAFFAKHAVGGMASVNHYGLADRVVQAIYGLWFYVFKSVLPQQLSPLYYKSPGILGMSLAFVLTALVAVLLFIFRRRLLAVVAAAGAALVLIFPMIGITQSGAQLFADRFTYLAAVPVSVLLAAWLSRVGDFRKMMFGALVVLLLMFGFQSSLWCRAWRDSLALWEFALEVDQKNPQAYNSAGLARKQCKQYARAKTYFNQAIRLNPGYVQAWHNRSLVCAILGEYDTAYEGWRIALSIPGVSVADRVRILWVRGWVSERLGEVDKALLDYNVVIEDRRVSPEDRAGALLLRANLYFNEDRFADSQADAEEVLLLPDAFETRHTQATQLIELIRERE